MPRALDVSLHPLLNRGNIPVAVFKLVSGVGAVAGDEIAVPLGHVGLGKRLAPASVLDVSRRVAGKGVQVGGVEVEVVRASRRVVVEEGVHVLHLAGVGFHAARRLARLNVAPHHRRHVALVVHEATVEVGSSIRVGRGDVGEATREWVLKEMEHGEEVTRGPEEDKILSALLIGGLPLGGGLVWEHRQGTSRRDLHQHVVSKPASNDRVVHDGLVRLVLEVRLPPGIEVGSGPSFELPQLFLRGPDFDPSLDAVRGAGPRALDVPFLEHAWMRSLVSTAAKIAVALGRLLLTSLSVGVSAGKVIERFGARLGTIHRECEVVVLEVEADAGKVDERFHANLLELVGVTYQVGRGQFSSKYDASGVIFRVRTDSRSLENQRRRQSTTRDDNLLRRLEDLFARILFSSLAIFIKPETVGGPGSKKPTVGSRGFVGL